MVGIALEFRATKSKHDLMILIQDETFFGP